MLTADLQLQRAGGKEMNEQNLNRRQILGGVAAGTAGLLGALNTRTAQAAEPAAPDMGASQAPPITDVKDKVAYITGGSSGIGLGIARALHEQGAKVVLGNLNDKQWEEALKHFPANDPRVATVVQDVMDRDAWERKADEIESKFGRCTSWSTTPASVSFQASRTARSRTGTGAWVSTSGDRSTVRAPSFRACWRTRRAATSSRPRLPTACCWAPPASTR
jgi:hypothetical protein